MRTDEPKALAQGLYELLLTVEVQDFLQQLGSLEPDLARLHPAEAANRIAFHMGRVIERSLSVLPEGERVDRGVELAAELIGVLQRRAQKAEPERDTPIPPGQLLRAVQGRRPDGSLDRIEPPLTPLLDTTLLTNAPGEPRVGRQVQGEVASAERIDLLMAFIRRTGLAPLAGPLRRHCDQGRPLRVLTTTYTGSTERQALDLLRDLGAEVRVSYDTTSTRLHAKAWVFHRASGFSTAYIGSSNLTHSAQVSGLEWNVRISRARNPDVLDKIDAVFASYWESSDFRPYDPAEFDERTRSEVPTGPRVFLSPVELRPEPFQERLLEQIAVSRERGFHRNLLAAATGTGKTVMAALDYAGLRRALPRARLLFVAHRKEILEQSQATFRHALRDPSFGEQWVAGQRPDRFEHVFASIQSLSAGASLIERALVRFADDFPPVFRQLGRLFIDHYTEVCDLWDEGEATLIHGDCHVGNHFVDGEEVGFYDWAVSSRSPGVRDVANFLCHSVQTDLRVAEQERLIRRYRDVLLAEGIEAPDEATLWRRYRRLVLYGWVAASTTAAMGDKWQPVAVGLEGMRRATRTCGDLETVEAFLEDL